MTTDKEKRELLVEAHRINYRLRSTFFYRKLNEYHTYDFPNTIKKLIPLAKEYDWKKFSEWGVTTNAFESISKTSLNLIQIFSHPRLIREHPYLTTYYRNVAALSQKSVGYLANINVGRFENGNKNGMQETEALVLSKLFNEHVSLIIETAIGEFSQEHITGLLFASSGAQIDGSWRNAIGDEAEKVVRKALIKEAIERQLLVAFLSKDSTIGIEKFDSKTSAQKIEKISDYRGFMLKNKKSVLFSSEPDISLIDTDGKTIAVIEVKGGTDPAGALERYGAAKKSFEESLRENPKVITLLVASCITNEVETRVKADKTIKKYYNLTRILTNEDEREKFLEVIFKELLNG